MNYITKILSIFFLSSMTLLLASSFNNKFMQSSIKLDIFNIVFILLILLVLILLFYMYKTSKTKKILSKYNKKYMENNYYLSTIVSDCIENLNNNKTKNVKLSLQEAKIYLNCVVDKDIVSGDNFNLYDFISNLYKDLEHIDCDIDFLNTTNLSYNITTSKDTLNDIIFTLISHQVNEHNVKKCITSVSLNRKHNQLKLEVLGLPFIDEIRDVVLKPDEPIYNFNKNTYSGIYLYMLSKLINKIGGTLEIDINANIYALKMHLPVKTETLESKVKLLLPVDKLDSISALVISTNEKRAKNIKKYLNSYNINSEYLNRDKLIDVPNFLSYDILIADSDYLKSIVSDYLLSIKNHSIKIVSLEDSFDSQYQDGLVDYSMTAPILQSKIYKMIIDFYSKACIDIDEKTKVKNSKKVENTRVLIADDSRVDLKFLKYMLESYGINVVTAINGKEAIDVLSKDDKFNLIILDSIMPVMDAYETVKNIRKNYKFNEIPVVINTAFSYQHSVEEIFQLGFDSYLPKPFTPEQLRAILHRYLKVNNNNVDNDKSRKEHLEEFVTVYANSGKILTKYIKQKELDRAKSLLNDLKAITLKINKRELLKSIKEVENEIELSSVNNDIVYALDKHIEYTAEEVQNELKSK